MKVTSSDLLAILRRFSVADDSNVPRHIDQIKQTHPSAINQLVQFRFNRSHYFVLFDETAEDSSAYIMQQIYTVKSDAEGVILENPTSDLTTYGLPFKGKDAYLFQLVSDKKRLDVLLAERHPEMSRSTWQKHIKAGNIAVNNSPARNAKQEVTEADHIAINIPDSTDFTGHELPIIYLDDDVIVVNKPAGVLTHSKGALNDEFTVAEFFRRYTTVGLDTNRPGIVHRLDRDTSGVIVGARTPESFDLLKSQFADRKAKKQYVAIVDGMPKQLEAEVDIPIGRNPSAPSTFRADSKGKPAITQYEVLDSRDNKSLISLAPKTGRTHQLRVHMQFLGTPILGDRVYGKPADRLYLHAYKLELTTAPEKRQTFIAPIPDDFRDHFPEVDNDVSRI
ncbi:MAG: RluA family pseudouridine synthase [Candidatus Saccharimonas sp.]